MIEKLSKGGCSLKILGKANLDSLKNDEINLQSNETQKSGKTGCVNTLRKPKNGIQWTGKKRWNTITGCTKISPGCKYCYADPIAVNLQKKGFYKYRNGCKLTIHNNQLQVPYTWQKPEIVFINSMSDIFHDDVPIEHIIDLFQIMNSLPQHQFQILTKRTERLLKIAPQLKWTENIWMGVSVENSLYTYRIDDLRKIPAKIRFISAEPLIGSLPKLNLHDIHWVIIGGENPCQKSRNCELTWIEDIVDQCDAQKVKVFVKQLGDQLGKRLGMTGKAAKKGDDYTKFPAKLRRWTFPINMWNYKHCFE